MVGEAGNQLGCAVGDCAGYFRPSPLNPPYLPHVLLIARRAQVRGVMLMRSFMDEVRYNSTGNEVTLQKSRFASLRNASPEA